MIIDNPVAELVINVVQTGAIGWLVSVVYQLRKHIIRLNRELFRRI